MKTDLAFAKKSIVAAVLTTWVVTAAWDFVCATSLSVVAYGSTFSRLWQGVASTVLGPLGQHVRDKPERPREISGAPPNAEAALRPACL